MAGSFGSQTSERSSQLSVRHLNRPSPLTQVQTLAGKTGSTSSGKSLTQTLQLTSMIDAFAIIVIYLLIGTQHGVADGKAPQNLHLPSAEMGATLEDSSIVRIEKGYYFVDDRAVTIKQLGAELFNLRKSNEKISVLVQADQAMDYRDLDPLIRALAEAGIQKVKFAIIPTGYLSAGHSK